MARLGLPLVSLLVAAGFVVQPAQADIYTWTDKAGVINVSNLPPPESASNTKVTRAAPRDAAREAAAVEAARQAEVRALADRVQQLQVELERSRRETPPPSLSSAPHDALCARADLYRQRGLAPAPAYAAPAGGCGYGFGWAIAVSASGRASTRPIPSWFAAASMLTITAASPIVIRGKHPHHHRRIGPMVDNSHLIPPLIPLPVQTRPGGGTSPRLVSCPVSSEDKGADEIGCQARREADKRTQWYGEAEQRSMAPDFRRELSSEFTGQGTSVLSY